MSVNELVLSTDLHLATVRSPDGTSTFFSITPIKRPSSATNVFMVLPHAGAVLAVSMMRHLFFSLRRRFPTLTAFRTYARGALMKSLTFTQAAFSASNAASSLGYSGSKDVQSCSTNLRTFSHSSRKGCHFLSQKMYGRTSSGETVVRAQCMTPHSRRAESFQTTVTG